MTNLSLQDVLQLEQALVLQVSCPGLPITCIVLRLSQWQCHLQKILFIQVHCKMGRQKNKKKKKNNQSREIMNQLEKSFEVESEMRHCLIF